MSLHRRQFVAASAAACGMAASSKALAGSFQDEVESDRWQPGKTPHTKFAVNVEMWFTDMPFLKRIERCADLGFPAVEFWPYKNKDLDAISKLCDERGIEIAQFTAWGFAPGMNNPKNESSFLDTIREACQVANDLNCRKMTVVAGNNQDGMTQKEMLAQVTRALTKAAPILEDAKVMAILEPMNGRVDHPGHCLYGSPDALAICREVDSEYVKINWDLYHMQITEGDLCGRMKEGLDQIGYLQLADHPGRHEPGTGEINYTRVLKEAHDLGYRDFVGLECRPTQDVKQALRRIQAVDQW